MSSNQKKLIFGNLKMNFLYHDFSNYIDELDRKIDKEQPKTELGIAVPYIFLERTASKLGNSINVIAQDVHHFDLGAFTSAISASQIASINVKWTLIGHSECRELKQNGAIITKKIKQALMNNLNVVYCCGADPLKEIKSELSFLTAQDLSRIVIAFEPISSIGTGQALNEIIVCKTINEIKDLIIGIWGESAKAVKLLYGGSVNVGNYKKYLEQNNIDGVLVGGASLKIDQLWQMAMLA